MSFILYYFCLIISYAFIGGGIKYLDAVSDRPQATRNNPPLWWVLTVALTFVIALWVLIDPYTTALALALVIGLVVVKKVDTKYFIVLAVITLAIVLLSLLRLDLLLFLLPTIIVLIPPVILDEALHAIGPRISHVRLRWLVVHRPILKIIVLILPFFGLFTIFHAIAFWSFDITYDLVAYYLRAQENVIK